MYPFADNGPAFAPVKLRSNFLKESPLQNDEKTLSCICKKQGCRRDDTYAIPSYCQAKKYLEEIDKAEDEYRFAGES